MDCPCGSRTPLEACCGRYLDARDAPTAEALMRSRYTAHVVGRVDYLVATHDPATRAAFDEAAAARWAADSTWLGLSVLAAEAGGPRDDRGTVEFAARFDAGQGPTVHHERSAFRRVDGAWVYVDGRPGRPPGRNAPCLCGSGKKVKRCCGA